MIVYLKKKHCLFVKKTEHMSNTFSKLLVNISI